MFLKMCDTNVSYILLFSDTSFVIALLYLSQLKSKLHSLNDVQFYLFVELKMVLNIDIC